MDMIDRHLSQELVKHAQKMPIIAVMGPRQSGKATLVKQIWKDYQYLNLENLDTRLYAQNDPRGFLAQYHSGVIIDEAQNVPELFSYLQAHVDQGNSKEPYILTGSQNFLLMERISQSLAGRVSINTLLPFSMTELADSSYCPEHFESYLYQGFYPRIYDKKLDPQKWLGSYIQTYVERDVRKLINVGDLSIFQAFVRMLAARIGQLINFTSISNELGVSYQTIKRWISVLEAGYIIFLLPPYYKNFNKRLVKTPKLYFYDSGLAAYLLGIESEAQIHNHYLKGALFEGMIIVEIKKQLLNDGKQTPLYFLRDKTGHEVDCIVESSGSLKLVEIKSGKTVRDDMFRGSTFWKGAISTDNVQNFIVYGGEEIQNRSNGKVLPWNRFIDQILK